MTTCSPAFSKSFAQTCLDHGIPVKVAAVWLWHKRLGEALEKPAFAGAFLNKVAAVSGAIIPDTAPARQCDTSVIHAMRDAIAGVNKRASLATSPRERVELALVRDDLQRRLNTYVTGE